MVQLAAAEWLDTAATMEEVVAGTTALLFEVVGMTAELGEELATGLVTELGDELGEELGVAMGEVVGAWALGLVVGNATVG